MTVTTGFLNLAPRRQGKTALLRMARDQRIESGKTVIVVGRNPKTGELTSTLILPFKRPGS